MKKFFSIIVCSVVAYVCLCACGEKAEPARYSNDNEISAAPVAAHVSTDISEDESKSGEVVVADGKAAVVYDELACLGDYDVLLVYDKGYCFPHGTFDIDGFKDWLISKEYYHSSFRLLIDSGQWFESSSGARFFSFGDEPPYMFGAKLGDFTGCSYMDLVDRDGNPKDFKTQDTVYECDFGKFYAAF